MEEREMASPEMTDDDEALMDQCALECMNAIQSGDKTAFRDSFQALIAHTLHELSEEMEPEEG